MATQQFTDGVTLTAASWFNDVDTAAYAGLTAAAGTNTITATGPTSMTAYAVNQMFKLIPANTNTGPATLNLTCNSVALGAKNIFLRGAALIGNELIKNLPVLVLYDGTQFNIVGNAFSVPVSRSAIGGLTYANNVADATNDIDIAAGQAADSTNAYVMALTAITKQSDVVWAVGSGNGGLDTGVVGNNDYYIWLIARPDTNVVDVLFSLSSTAPTMPANYTLKRIIGWFKRSGATVVAFHTYETDGGGLEMNWDTPTLDVNLSNTLTTARRTDAVKVPLNFSTVAHIRAMAFDASATFTALVCCPDETDVAVSQTTAPLANLVQNTIALRPFIDAHIRTSSTGTLAARADIATVDTYAIVTVGFRWARR